METDDDFIKANPSLAALCSEDLSDLGAAELEARIKALEGEITRCKTAIGARSQSRADAEAFFRS